MTQLRTITLYLTVLAGPLLHSIRATAQSVFRTRALLPLCLGLLFAIATTCASSLAQGIAGPPNFHQPANYTVGNQPSAIAVGDVNGDGHPDLLTANAIDHTISVLLGNGDGTFRPALTVPSVIGMINSIVVGDFNGDGHLDLAVTGPGGGGIGLALGNGDGTFKPMTIVSSNASFAPGVLAVADFNKDGHLDLAAAGSSTLYGAGVYILLGNGDGTFQTPAPYVVGTVMSIAVGDLNGDGNLDLVTANDDDTVGVLLGKGDGSFQLPLYYFTRPNSIQVVVGDFNGDGRLDVAALSLVHATVSILLGNGDGSLQSEIDTSSGLARAMAAADFNGDGHLDLVLVGNFAGAGELSGNGDGTFQPLVALPGDQTMFGQSVISADFNGDGLPDFSVGQFTPATATTGTLTVYINAGQSVTCMFSLNPSAVNDSAAVNTGSLTVTVNSQTCPWSASSNVPWATVTSFAGTGTGAVNYRVDANTGAARMGTLTAAGLTFTINQAAASGGGGGNNGCACTKVGAYVNPAQAIDAISDAPQSPTRMYTVTATIDNTNQSTDLVVTLTSNGTVVMDTGLLPITTHWGFSPDDNRFIYHYLTGVDNGLDNVYIYDLSATPRPRQIVYFALSTQVARPQFSPSGRYFLYTAVLGTSFTQLQIYRIQGVTTQALEFSGNFNFSTGSGGDQFGGVDWGFSPDSPETSFVYAYVTGQSTFQWNVVNLTAQERQVTSQTITTIASFWQYDPCGDVIALVTQPSATQDQIDLFETGTGLALPGSGATVASLSITLETTSSGQEVVYSGQPTLLSPPSCGQPNTPTGTSVTVTPEDSGSATSPMDVTFASVTQAGQTTVTLSNTGSPAPPNFKIGNPPTYYDLTTTATFSGTAAVCINYSGISFTNQSAIRLYHFENGAWVDHTVSVNTTTKTVCGTVASFSPFALFEPSGPAAAAVTPAAGTPQSANVNSVFPAPLQVSVTDAAGNAVSGVTVLFVAPAVGATGTFAGGGAQATVTTNAAGMATAPAFTADAVTGTYIVMAAVDGVPSTANFSLTNSQSSTTLALGASTSSAVYGTTIVFTATVNTNRGTPTGTVQFFDGGAPLAAVPLNGATAMFTSSSFTVGVHSITASYSGDSNFRGSVSSAFSATVVPAPLTLMANNTSRQYGQSNPPFTVSYSGFVNGDTASALTGTLSCSTTATASSPAGTYPISCSGLSSTNYTITYVPGQLTITPPPCASSVTASVAVTRSGFSYSPLAKRYAQTLTLTNTAGSTITGPIYVILDNLTSSAALYNTGGSTACAAPTGSPYVSIAGPIGAGASTNVVLQFTDPTNAAISYATRFLAGTGQP
jgi:hypothetical protein